MPTLWTLKSLGAIGESGSGRCVLGKGMKITCASPAIKKGSRILRSHGEECSRGAFCLSSPLLPVLFLLSAEKTAQTVPVVR